MLTLQDIVVRFGGITASGGVSLSVRRGEVCGLIGPNGAGKTTLFDVVSGVRRPERGRVVMDGVDMSSLGPPQRCWKGLRRTFQRVQTFGWLTVEDNVLAAIEWRGGGGGLLADLVALPTRRRRERERRALAAAGGRALRSHEGALRVRRLAADRHRPDGGVRGRPLSRRLLLLDEPAAGLDEEEATRLGEQIEAVRADTGCAVLLVEHNASFIMERSDRIVVLSLGSVLAEGSPEAIQADPMVRSAYLGEGSQDGGAR